MDGVRGGDQAINRAGEFGHGHPVATGGRPVPHATETIPERAPFVGILRLGFGST